jgi:phosphohistidine swiveling domain-containing protein
MEKEIEKLKPVLFTTYNKIADFQTNRKPEKENELRKLIRKTSQRMKPFIAHIPEYKQRFIKGLLALDETELSIREEIFLLDEAVAEMHIRLRRDRTPIEKNQPWTEELLGLLNNKRNWGQKDGTNEELQKEKSLPDKIKGLGVETGQVEGKVQIITGGGSFSMLKRDRILVTEMTSPDLFPYFGRLKGIITEQGGRLCHAAIIAREFDIPCIVGCENAMDILQDEQMVNLDSKKGEVFLID